MLQKIEKAIENGQSRDTGNIGHTTHRGKKQIKKTHTTQTPKKISNTDPTKNSHNTDT